MFAPRGDQIRLDKSSFALRAHKSSSLATDDAGMLLALIVDAAAAAGGGVLIIVAGFSSQLISIISTLREERL